MLTKLPNSGIFSFDLGSFGVPYGAIPQEKRGGNFETGMPEEGRDYYERYITKDGNILEAGIKYAAVPHGVDHKDYFYRYVKVLNPTVNGVVCEEGQIHVIDKDGYAVEQHVDLKLQKYEKDRRTGGEKRVVVEDEKYYAIPSNYKLRYFPCNEQQERENVMKDAIRQFTAELHSHDFPYAKGMAFDLKTGWRINNK